MVSIKTLMLVHDLVKKNVSYTSLIEVYVWWVSDSRDNQRVGTRVCKKYKIYQDMTKTSYGDKSFIKILDE